MPMLHLRNGKKIRLLGFTTTRWKQARKIKWKEDNQ